MAESLKKYILGAIAIICVAIGVFWLRSGPVESEKAESGESRPTTASVHEKRKNAKKTHSVSQKSRPQMSQALSAEDRPDASEDENLTAEEKREAEEEKLVDAFDALTDSWMESEQKKRVTMEDIETFNQQFRKVPLSRREECLHRALNLIPDENVMLLAGILMDKSYDSETLELVYNDVLNRDEDVKKPILREIFKDKTHPCWADTAWILDVTGDLPGKKSE